MVLLSPYSLRAPALGSVQADAWRSGRVGVAHATGICALVHNISQAWGSAPILPVTIRRHKGYPAIVTNTPLGGFERRLHCYRTGELNWGPHARYSINTLI